MEATIAREETTFHDNARLHIALATSTLPAVFQWSVVPHPPYNPDFASSNYLLIGCLKKYFRGIHIKEGRDLKDAGHSHKLAPTAAARLLLIQIGYKYALYILCRKWVDQQGEYFEV